MHTGFQLGDLREREHLEDLGIDGRIILKWILKWMWWGGGVYWIDLAQDWNVAGACECGNEPSGSIKCGEFLEFDGHATVQHDKFLVIRPTRCTNFSNLSWKETLHVSDSSSVHH